MLIQRKSTERGSANHGWLDARHSFSFAGYHDPRHMGFRTLRVINQDVVAPSAGFPPHSHADMEIVTYVLRGEIEHRDSMGNKARIKPGEVQIMSAGTGVTHSEYNASETEPLELLQIWILPERRGLEPSYAQLELPPRKSAAPLQLVVSPAGESGSLKIHQDARLSIGRLSKGATLEVPAKSARHYWLQVVKGEIDASDGKDAASLGAGDGLAVVEAHALQLRAKDDVEFLLFDLG